MAKSDVKPNKLQAFVIWLDGYIDAVGEDGFNISKTNMVRNKLNNLFEHEADKLGDEQQNSINLTLPTLPTNYDLPQDPNGPVVYRC
jgi:hypothetical protein